MQVKQENESLTAVKKEQEKALADLKDQELGDQLSQLNTELKEAKVKLRKLQYKQREEERILRQQHEHCIVLDERIKRMEQLVKDKK